MAKPAPERVMHAVREIGSETVVQAHPIDAREMVASGAYEYVDDPAPAEVRTASGEVVEKAEKAEKAKSADAKKAEKAAKAEKAEKA